MAQQHTPAAGSGSTFTHEPETPNIWVSIPTKRYFGYPSNEPLVYRHDYEGTAILRLTAANKAGWLEAHLNADEAEALARRLVDAAHDLRMHTAYNLMRSREGGAA
jgi:hypothetical protein